jgi:hypothetical protein
MPHRFLAPSRENDYPAKFTKGIGYSSSKNNGSQVELAVEISCCIELFELFEMS